ncbi:carbohydrate deacetylase [Lentibacillus kapialis]|uniref:Carbohydrate deacetylase n=1 Tax=Lentibacillus kapialis TaxID=340214 RepID=A0A917PVS3_9BACI|nr:chitin disaccharide deacetylase [Lentibacillus kapialis]GGJ94184.1 carbohydrate deacetylase [Lentibacillus kapialis]
MKVLFNADDFGLTKGITDGIIKSHLHGVVQSTTMMMNGRAVDYAVQQAKKLPNLNVGVHLVLTWGKPISNSVSGLLDRDGYFKYTNTFREMEPPDPDDVEKEWRAQIEAFLQKGLPLHHIDSHHHIHGWEPLNETVRKLATEYGVPVRRVDSLQSHPGILLTDKLWLDFYGDGVGENVFDELKKIDAPSVEVMTHPAFVDKELKAVSSYAEKRQEELNILCRLKVPDWVELADSE